MDRVGGTYQLNEGFEWSADCQDGLKKGGNNVSKVTLPLVCYKVFIVCACAN